MKGFTRFKIVDSEFIVKHNLKFVDNAKANKIFMEFLFSYYNIIFEIGLCFVYKDRFNYYITGQSNFCGYIKLNKIWLCYMIYKSYILKANKVVKILLKS